MSASPNPSREKAPENGLSTLFFRNGHLLALAITVLIVAGFSALNSLPRLEDPRITNRNPLLLAPVPGASAERVETQVVEVIEEALQEIPEISILESTARGSIANIAIELEPAVGPGINQELFAEIRDKISEVRPQLPPEALDPFLDDQRGAVGFTTIIALRSLPGDDDRIGLLDRLAEDLADRLRNVGGTELVRIYGAPEEEITVSVDAARLADLGLSAAAVSQRISTGDAKGAAGVLRGTDSDVLLEVRGELDSLARIAEIPLLANADGAVVRVGDVAQVRREPRSPASDIALLDGQTSVLVAVRMVPDQRVDRWADRSNQVIDDFAAEVRSSALVERIFEQERYTSRQLSSLGENLMAGALVVMAVIFLIMGWRLALIVGLALPLVVSVVLFSWQVSGGAIHQMSIFGMIIALGLLIDNAIVVADEVTHHKATGATAVQAVDRAVRHLFYPLLASTLTTMLAFAPILLLPGSIGDFVGTIGSSVMTAVFASFVLALTLTAALAGRFAQPTPKGETARWWRDGLQNEKLAHRYRQALAWNLRNPIAALLLALFLPASGFVAARTLGNEFFPPVDRDMFQLQMWLPTDAPLEETRRQALAVEDEIRSAFEAERVMWRLGGSFPTVYYNQVMRFENTSNYAQAIITAPSTKIARAMIDPLQAHLDEAFPGAQIVVRQFGQGPPIFADVEYRIFGPSLAKLQDLGEQVRHILEAHPDVLHTQMSLPRGEPKLWLDADEDEARLAGFSLRDLAGQLQTNLEGSVGGTVIEGLEQMPVRVRYENSRRGDLGEIASIPLVRPGQEGWVTLPALGDLELLPELGGISRYNGERTHIVSGYTRNDALPIDVSRDVQEALEASDFTLPAGYRLEFGGAQEKEAQARGDLLTYAPVLLVLTVATLILAFRSLRLAGLLGLVAVLSIGLGLLSTRLMGFPVSFNTILGTLGLIGVALNDSIVVLAALNSDARARQGNLDAMVDAIMGCTRHVLATTLTTIGGFLPLLLFVGGDFWPSLAIVLVGGISGASLLALILIPTVFSSIHRRRPQTELASASNEPLAAGGVA